MVSSQQGGEYLSFEQYNDYKSKLNDSHNFIHDEDEYRAFFKAAIPEGTQNEGEIMKNCFKLKKYLLNFKSDETCSNGKCCSYMNYWLNRKIQESKANLNESDFYVYNEYIEYLNGPTDIKVCKSNKFSIRNDIFGEMKKLYSLYELYNTFKTNSDNIDRGCSKLSSCVMYYNNIVGKCIQKKKNSDFCKALQNFKNIFSTDNFVSTRNCGTNFGELKLKDTEDLPELVLQQVDFNILQVNRKEAKRALLENSPHSQGAEHIEGGSDSIRSSFSHSNLIQTLFSSAFGISILFLLSYKFTPFGKWMRSALLRKNIITHYETEEDTQDILSHTYENTNIDTDDSIHNIQYYATQNS
ncbi:PIR Superfamily Protein [Plasmodium ovale wallikeri]|uniref:PIR Superfamily Protein n=1 Tax=Plasmodium ovale wallikeri TaxID=864142 RepID=A0A1A9AM88_PLAOA|nr:PIR Superfamily Protein [Plasmodium ovale wallikeri]SBT57312.1 PIR Superfamily Protein [Plasmodium ovale wallikeri]